MPDSERDLLVLLGPEPHFRWPELAPAIIHYARAAGVESMLTLGAYVGPVSHHNAPVVRRTLDAELGARLDSLELPATDYEGPTAFVTALLHAAAARVCPPRASGSPRRRICRPAILVAALALLDATLRVTRVPLEVGRLSEVADSFLHDVETALEEHPELAEQLKEMLEAEAEDDDERGRRQRARRPRPLAWPRTRPATPRCPTRPAQRQGAGRGRREILQQRKDDDPNPARPRGLTRPPCATFPADVPSTNAPRSTQASASSV